MKDSRKLVIALFIALIIVYFGGWRIFIASSDQPQKVLEAWERSYYETATRITENLVMNPELSVYVYKTKEDNFISLVNIYEQKYAYGSIILALLIVALPFGIFIF